MAKQNPAVYAKAADSAELASETDHKITARELWPEMERSYKSMTHFRNTSLDRWYRKALLGAGGSLKNSSHMLNQGISSQVTHCSSIGEDKVNTADDHCEITELSFFQKLIH